MPLPSTLVNFRQKLLFSVLLIVLVFIFFSPVLQAQFFNWQDGQFLKISLHKPLHGEFPLTNLSFAFENHFSGLNPFIYHLDNLLLHIIVVILAFWFALELGVKEWQAFLGALIFALHPSQVETVVWISKRQELLYAVFYLASLISYHKKKYWLSLFLAVLSMLASPMGLSIFLAMVYLDWRRGQKVHFEYLSSHLPRLLVLIIAGLAIFFTQVVFTPSFFAKCFQNLGAFVFYLKHFIVPVLSTPFYVNGPYLIAVDHIFYLPNLIICMVLASLIGRLYEFLKTQEAIIRHLFTAALLVLILGLGFLTFNQCRLWQNPVDLWRYQIKTAPHPIALNYLAMSLRASCDYAQGSPQKIKEITELYKRAIKLDPHNASSHCYLAQFYEEQGHFDAALAEYDKAIKIDPRNKESLFGLALIYQKMDKPRQSIDTFNLLLKAYPEDEDVYASVIDAYNRAVSNFPNQQEYKEQREEVLSSYEQLSKRKKYSAVDYFNLGFLYEQVGGYDEAIRFYKKSLELNPNYEKSLYNLANRYQEMGEFKTALPIYQRLVHYHPKYALGYLNMGVIYNAMGDVAQARSSYQKTIEVDPTNAGGYFNLGFLSEQAGDLKGALNYYEKAVEYDPNLAEGYYNMGNVYAALGQNAEAIASYLKTVAINQSHQNAFVNLSILSFKSGDFAHAISYLEKAQTLGYTPPSEYVKSLAAYKKK